MDMDVEVDVDIESYSGCLKGVSKSGQVLLNGTEAVLVLTAIILKQRAVFNCSQHIFTWFLSWCGQTYVDKYLGLCSAGQGCPFLGPLKTQ